MAWQGCGVSWDLHYEQDNILYGSAEHSFGGKFSAYFLQ